MFSWLFNRTVLVLLGLVALALVIWFVGPLVKIADWAPLEKPLVRAILIALIFLTWIVVRLVRWWRERSANAALLNQISGQEGAQAKAAGLGEEEVAELRRRFDAAIQTLKKSRIEGGGKGLFARFSRRYVYQMPWYMIIGAPGSGKTTALVNSGIEFPLAKEFGKAAIRGVGGTRNCDWWFTNEAVLLDTAGRYTTQESNEALDRAEWTGFLSLLRRYRPRAPINGVLLTVSVPDLLATDEAERERHAAIIRRRLTELDEALHTHFPVYVLVTKVDLLGGFNEYFARLSNDERAQVWGFTLPLKQSETSGADVAASFRGEFALLQKRVEDALPDVLQGEIDVQRRGLVYAFPQELAGLRAVLDRFLGALFAPSKFSAPPLVRGVYLTSGTQEGTPFDRVLSAIQRQFGVSTAIQSATAAQGTGRSYFLRNLLQKVVFAESHLVERDPARDRRRRILQAVGVAACVLLLVGSVAGWIVSYYNNRAYLAEVRPRADALAQTVRATPNTTTDDLVTLLPILDDALALPVSDKFAPLDAPPLSYRFALYQGRKVGDASAGAYDRLLEDLLLPRVALRIRRLLAEAPADDLEARYGRLKAYLMLYDAAHYDGKYLLAAVTADWLASEANNLPREAQQSLIGHLSRLFSDRVRSSPFPIDEALVADARGRLAQYTQAQRLYGQVKAIAIDKAQRQLPDFTIVAAAGPDSKLVFTRASGKPLDQGVPALYTRDGYRIISGLLLDRRALLQLDETWVIGRSAPSAASQAADLLDDRLVGEIRRYYLEDYRISWDRFLNDLRLVTATNLDGSINLARTLSAPDSPLVKLVTAVARETTLTETGKQTTAMTDRATEAVKQATTNTMSRVFGSTGSTLARGATSGEDPNKAGRIEKEMVDDYFEPWRRLAGSPQQAGSVEALRALIGELYTTLLATQSALRTGGPPPVLDTGTKLRAEAARLPMPMRAWFETLGTTASTQTTTAARTNVGAQLDAAVGDFCRKAIGGRYPFVKNSPNDVTPDDFARIFAPGGLMDDFFQKNLSPYVDTSTHPWTFRKGVDGAPAGTSASILSFQRAAVIRDVFFRGGGRVAQFRVDVKPVEMDPSITTFTLDADGTTLSYVHGPQVPRSIVWPGPAGRNQLRVQVTPQTSGTSGFAFDGPWALHRFFDKAQVTPGPSPERFTATLNFDGRRVVLEVTAPSVQNPFRLRELEEFSCPSRL